MTALSLAREKVVRIALEVVVEERRLADRAGAASRLPQLDNLLAFAARDLVAAVDELEPVRKPRGWVVPAIPDDRLISPECRAGKHRACKGDPCECMAYGCHTSGEPGVAP